MTQSSVTAILRSDHRTVDLVLPDAPDMQVANDRTVTPVAVRISYGFGGLTVRIDGRVENGYLDYYDGNDPKLWPAWLAELVEQYRPQQP